MARKKIKLAWFLCVVCHVPVCIVIFSPNEVTVWPSVEEARELLEEFFALPEIGKKKNETSLASYLKKKLTKTQTKNKNAAIDKLMVQIHSGCNIEDLNLSDIYQLISFTKDKVKGYRENLNLVHYPPLRDPPPPPVPIFMTKTNGNKSYYMVDEWVLSNPIINQPFQLRYINGIPTLDMSEPIQYPFDFMSRGFGANEGGTSTVNLGDSQFRTLAITDGVRRESSPPPNETSFDYEPDF